MKGLKNVLIFIGVSGAILTVINKNNAPVSDQSDDQKSRYITHIDSILSTSASQEVAQFVKNNQKKAAQSSDFVELLVSTFPYIRTIEMQKTPASLCYIDIESSCPILSINDNYVLTDHGAITQKEVFNTSLTHDLYALRITTLQTHPILSQNLKKTIAQLPPHFFDSYEITLIDETEGWLYDKSNDQFAILFNGESIPDDAMLARCHAIKNDLQTRGIFEKLTKKKNNCIQCVADVRFKNQIIIRESMGGRQHG